MILKHWSCCCCVSLKEAKRKSRNEEAVQRQHGKAVGKSSDVSGFLNTSSAIETTKKPQKVSLGIDISTVGETVGEDLAGTTRRIKINNTHNDIFIEEDDRNTEYKHPAAQYPTEIHWAERQRDMQEKFCDGLY